VAALHAGWRGTAAGILDVGLAALDRRGYPPADCVVHLGPAICGPCYEVGPEVLAAVHGRSVSGKGQLDVRGVLVEQARRAGVSAVSVSPWCTRCHAARFFSHRGGDAGRQLGVIALR
jgi:copper oxidase (laccase) domain-containing protein